MAETGQWRNYPNRTIVTPEGDDVADDTADAIRVLPRAADGSAITEWRGFTLHPFAGGLLTPDGVQYTAPFNTTTADTNYTVATYNVSSSEPGTIKELQLGLTAMINSVSNVETGIKYHWQGRNSTAVSWVDLNTELINIPGGTSLANTVSGYFAPTTNFDAIPFQLQLIAEANINNEGHVRIRNSSYFTVIYEPS